MSKDKDSVNVAFNATYDYDAFGNLTENTGSEATNNPFRYNGQYHDDETGLLYLRNRYYDPSIGRFTQEYPAKDGLNWYVYCENNPITRIDPDGESWRVTSNDIADLGVKYTGEIVGAVINAGSRARDNAKNKAEIWGYYDNDGNVLTWDNRADAMRHFQWNAVMAREIGYGVAKYAADRHEINGAKETGYFREENENTVRMRVGQATLMDLWNNAVGRKLAYNRNCDYMNYDELFYYAESNNLLILDANYAFDFFGINDYVDWNDWTVGVIYNINDETITVMKEGLPDITLKVGFDY